MVIPSDVVDFVQGLCKELEKEQFNRWYSDEPDLGKDVFQAIVKYKATKC